MAPPPPPELLVLQHDADKGLGLLEAPLRAAGIELDVRLAGRDAFELGEHAGVVALPGLADPVDESESVSQTRQILARALGRELPVLGICLGAELLAEAGGGSAYRCTPEFGYRSVGLTAEARDDALLGSLPSEVEAFQAHAFAVRVPAGAAVLGSSEHALQAFRLGRRAWGIQFHPEPTARMVAAWVATIRAHLERAGVDPDEVVARAQELEPSWTAWAAAIGAGFAAAVRAAG
jgi:GMP synthase-like glutamine amidotransferase